MASHYELDRDDLREVMEETRIVQLTDDEQDGSQVDARVLAAIEAVEALLHESAGVFYETPLRLDSDPTKYPLAVRERLLQAAAYRLIARKPFILHEEDGEGAHWRRVWKEFLAWLDAIAQGKVVIPQAVKKGTPASVGGGASVVSDTSVFTFESVKGF